MIAEPAHIKELTAPLRTVLRSQVSFTPFGEPRRDAVLSSGLTTHQTEQEWLRVVQTNDAVHSALQQRLTLVHGKGLSYAPGKSGSIKASMYRDWTECMISNIHQGIWHTWTQEVLQTPRFGFLPNQISYTPSFMFDGESYLGIKKVQVEKPWLFNFSSQDENGDRHLMRRNSLGGSSKNEWSSDVAEAKWLITRYGSTSDPYGKSVLHDIWTLFKLREIYQSLQRDAVSLSMGILKVKELDNAPKGKDGAVVADELSKALTLLKSGVIHETEGYELDWLKNDAYVDKHIALMEDLDERMTIALVGQNLSMRVKAGSRAATSVHVDKILGGILRSDARMYEAWITDLVRKAIDLNFPDVAADDYPIVRSGVFTDIDAERVKEFAALPGARVDGKALADQWNIPLLPEDRDPDALMPVGAALIPPDSVVPALASDRSSRTLVETEEGLASTLSAAESQAQGDSERLLQAQTAALMAAFLAVRKDPKALPR